MKKKSTSKTTKRGFLYFMGAKPVPKDAPSSDSRVFRLLRKRKSGTRCGKSSNVSSFPRQRRIGRASV